MTDYWNITSIKKQDCTYLSSLSDFNRTRILKLALGIILLISACVSFRVAMHFGAGKLGMIPFAFVPIGLFLILNASCIPRTIELTERRKQRGGVFTIGSAEASLSLEGIKEQLKVWKNENREELDALIVYGKGINFNTDPGFLSLKPKKIILVDCKIVHEPSFYRLDDELSRQQDTYIDFFGKKMKHFAWLDKGPVRDCNSVFNTHVAQLKMDSVQEALDHKPPKYRFENSLHWGTYRVVYVVPASI
jgi:hypothetical protein